LHKSSVYENAIFKIKRINAYSDMYKNLSKGPSYRFYPSYKANMTFRLFQLYAAQLYQCSTVFVCRRKQQTKPRNSERRCPLWISI